MNPPDKRFDIVVVGEINPDLILSGNVVPEFGQVEKLVDQAVLAIGSSSAIFACGAACLGMRVGFIGKVGEDTFGRFMLAALRERGVDTGGVVVDSGVPTGLSVILSQGNDRAILTFPGAIPRLTFNEINLEYLAQARHLHLAGYFIQDALRPDVARLFQHARQLGLSTSLDTNYDPSESWDGGLTTVLQFTDIFLPNATEACAIAHTADITLALGQLAQRIPTVAVKLGAQGARAISGENAAETAALSVRVVDTVGAGDSFNAGFLSGILSGWDLQRSLRLGVVCGSLSTRGSGGTAAQASMSEALAYL